MKYFEIVNLLKNAGIEDPQTEARLLLEHYTGRSSVQLLMSPDTDWEAPALEAAVQERMSRRPLQYIFGEWSFWNETYEVHEGCLIPRPDTETLVEAAVRKLPRNAFFLDLCSGSGCIGISVLATRKDAEAVAADVDPELVALANRNAARNGVSSRYRCIQSDVLSEDISKFTETGKRPAAILSNPPYIPSSVIPSLSEEVHREPALALDGGDDGLRFYRHFISRAGEWIPGNGFFLFEIGYDQGSALMQMAADARMNCEIIKDLAGLDRVACVSFGELL